MILLFDGLYTHDAHITIIYVCVSHVPVISKYVIMLRNLFEFQLYVAFIIDA